MIIFVHVPKTGGTSIRFAATEHFGEDNSLFDYGPEAPRTSPIVQQLLYQSDPPQLERLYEWIYNHDIAFLSGHFTMERYPTAFPEADVITWVRDPVERVRSHHQHRTRVHGETRELDEFSEKPRWRNRIIHQTGRDASLFACIGVLERQEESLALLKQRLGVELQPRHDNRVTEQSHVSNELRERISKRNRKDGRFVRDAHRILDTAEATNPLL